MLITVVFVFTQRSLDNPRLSQRSICTEMDCDPAGKSRTPPDCYMLQPLNPTQVTISKCIERM